MPMCPCCGYAGIRWSPCLTCADEPPRPTINGVTLAAAYALGVREASDAIALVRYDAERMGQDWRIADAKIAPWRGES